MNYINSGVGENNILGEFAQKKTQHELAHRHSCCTCYQSAKVKWYDRLKCQKSNGPHSIPFNPMFYSAISYDDFGYSQFFTQISCIVAAEFDQSATRCSSNRH